MFKTTLRVVMGLAGLVFVLGVLESEGTQRLRRSDRRLDQARLDLSNLCVGTRLFFGKSHAYPTALKDLTDSHVLPRVPKDPWGREYIYELGPDGPKLRTYGSDGAPGGEGNAQDLQRFCDIQR